jgi:hypothetical protein
MCCQSWFSRRCYQSCFSLTICCQLCSFPRMCCQSCFPT